MQSFYPPRGQRQSAGGEKKDTAARSSDPENVWRAACLIPEGCVTSYGEISSALGRPWTPRLVGQALKKNPYAPTVPCHRVVKADRSLGGYFGATSLEDEKMKTKVQLLESEGVQFQNAGAVAAESFWRFPKDVDLEAVELPPTKHRRTSDELAEGDVKPAEKGLVRLTSGTTVSNAMAM